MRVVLAGSPFADPCTFAEVDCYLSFDDALVVNQHRWTPEQKARFEIRYGGNPSVACVSFDPCSPGDFLQVLAEDKEGVEAIVCSPAVRGLTEDVLRAAVARQHSTHRLVVVACPNAAVEHLTGLMGLAAAAQIAIIHTPDVHADGVAEYTVGQIMFHSRRLWDFYRETGREGSWPHAEGATSTHLVSGKTLGVIGGSGRDGSAVISLALRCGMKVLSIGSGSDAGTARIRDLGAEAARDLEELVAHSDFISINCSAKATRSLITKKHFDVMKRGVIVINPSGADVFERDAVIREFEKAAEDRRVSVLVLDMPFGNRRDDGAFAADPINEKLRSAGVLFTPRIAGYTVESAIRSATGLAEYIHRFVDLKDYSVPIVNSVKHMIPQGQPSDVCRGILRDALLLAKEAAAKVIQLREVGLTVNYKSDGSPLTNADQLAENIIREGLRERGHRVNCIGEESDGTPASADNHGYQVVIDGIDGTRNFRDGNFGWCISVAVRYNGVTIGGLVYDPPSRVAYSAMRDEGAFVESGGLRKRVSLPETLFPDFSFSIGSFRVKGSTAVKALIISDMKALGGHEREWGSVALSICAVARGGLGAFIQGNSHEHDHIAAILIAQEAGADVVLHAKSESRVADVIVSHPNLSARVNSAFNERTGKPPVFPPRN